MHDDTLAASAAAQRVDATDAINDPMFLMCLYTYRRVDDNFILIYHKYTLDKIKFRQKIVYFPGLKYLVRILQPSHYNLFAYRVE